MSRVMKRHWTGNLDALSRRGRMPCDYEAYVPDPLLGRTVTLDGDVAADVTDAEAALMLLNARATALADTEGLARLLLRAESVASSRIEGLEIGARKLLRTEAARQLGERTIDLTATEVIGNINAMNGAVHEIGPGDQITLDTLLGFHRHLMANSRLTPHAGRLREQQNWIGGSDYNPCSAAFVPPPPELVPNLMDDLCTFCNDDSLPAVAQAALAHAQFETIHPFADGNGRAGRGLIHLVLRRRGLATRVLPPVSLVLETGRGITSTGSRPLGTRDPRPQRPPGPGSISGSARSPEPAYARPRTRPPSRTGSNKSRASGVSRSGRSEPGRQRTCCSGRCPEHRSCRPAVPPS